MQDIVYDKQYELENSYWWFVARNTIVRDTVEKVCNFKPDDLLLDVGCGTGSFTRKLSEKYDVIGIDMSPKAVEYSQKRGLKNIQLGTLDTFERNGRDIRGVFFLDVIEHIEDDVKVVAQAYSNVAKGGYIVATVPAYQWMWSRHDEIHMHYRRYTRKKFVKLLKNAGFHIDYSTYFNTFLLAPAMLKRMLDKITGADKKNDNPIDEVPDSINTLFKNIFLAEKNFLPKVSFPFGLSIMVIGRKL